LINEKFSESVGKGKRKNSKNVILNYVSKSLRLLKERESLQNEIEKEKVGGYQSERGREGERERGREGVGKIVRTRKI